MEKLRVWTVFVGFVAAVVGITVLTLVAFAVTFGPGSLGRMTELAQSPSGVLLAATVSSLVLLVCALLFSPRPVQRLRLQPSAARPVTLVAIVVGGLALSSALDSATALLGLYDHGALAIMRDIFVRMRGPQLLLALLVVGLLAGTGEELFFRGFVQTRLARRWRPAVAVVVTSVLFGLMHMDAVHTPFATCIGLWLGFVTERAGSVRPAVAAHVVNNVAACAGAAAGLATSAFLPNLVGLVISAAVFGLCARHVIRALPARRPEGSDGRDLLTEQAGVVG
jgi:uncharacterized protein